MNTNTSKDREDRALFENLRLVASGDLTIIRHSDNTTSFGFRNLHIWIPTAISKQSLPKHELLTSNDQDKFLVNSYDYETARSEFFTRWKIYIHKRFNSFNVPIEVNNTITEND